MANEPMPLRSSEELLDENLVSPLSSTGLPSTELKKPPLHSIFSTSGYERVNLDYGDIEAVNKEDTFSQPRAMPRSSTDSLGIYPVDGDMANNKSLCRKSVSKMSSPDPSSCNTPQISDNYLDSPETPDGRLSRGRFHWGTLPKINHVFQKLRPRGRTGRVTEAPRQKEAASPNEEAGLKDAATAASSPYLEAKERHASLPSEMDLEPANGRSDDEDFEQKFGA